MKRDDILAAIGVNPDDLPPLRLAAIPDDVDTAAAAEVAAEQIQARLDAYLKRRPAEFETSGELDALLRGWAQRLLAGTARNLVIHGNVGTGKTWSAWRLGEELIQQGYRGRIEIMSAYRLKRLFAPPTDYADIDRLAGADLLALDDIGAVRVSEWDADLLGGLIDERTARQRPTIIVANPPKTSPQEGQTLMQALLGERVASRLAKDVTVVPLTGPDRRRTP